MDADAMFSGKYLNVETVKSNGIENVTLTVIGAVTETIQGLEKLGVVFDDVEEPLILNKTNYLIIREKLGNDTDKWKGAKLKIGIGKTMFQGKMIPAMSVKDVTKA